MPTDTPINEQQPLIANHAAQQPLTLRPHLSELVKSMIAAGGAGIAVIAVLPVPYLVARSVFYLTTAQDQFNFIDMLNSKQVSFWLLGPTAALLSTCAIAPFNFYNTYKTLQNWEFNRQCFSLKRLLTLFGGVLFLTSGAVNGYNMNALCLDMMPSDNLAKRITQYYLVTLGTLLAGISEGRAVLSYLQSDLPYRLRYVKRGAIKTQQLLTARCGFFQTRPSNVSVTRATFLAKLQTQLDDIKTISLLDLTHTEARKQAQLAKALNQMITLDINLLSQFFGIANRPFPMGRFLASEVGGTLAGGILVYFGNQNTLYYAQKAFAEFEQFCGLAHPALAYINYGLAILAYTVGVSLGLFLIHDLFMRDLLKRPSLNELRERSLKGLWPLIPAFSFGLLNIIMTLLNASLNPAEKILVSLSAMIGATAVSRYGIEGGIEEFLGRSNPRRELANATTHVMEQLKALDESQLEEVDRAIPSNRLTY